MQKFMTIKFDRDCPVAQFFDHNQNDEEMMSLVSLNKIVIDIHVNMWLSEYLLSNSIRMPVNIEINIELNKKNVKYAIKSNTNIYTQIRNTLNISFKYCD